LVREKNGESFDFGWLPAFPHALVASMSNFLFGYHIGSVSLSLYVGVLFFGELDVSIFAYFVIE
jgi:hypothetical protein